jgi:hypothetical protein
MLKVSNENEKAAIANCWQHIHALAEAWCNCNITHGPLCKKLLP